MYLHTLLGRRSCYGMTPPPPPSVGPHRPPGLWDCGLHFNPRRSNGGEGGGGSVHGSEYDFESPPVPEETPAPTFLLSLHHPSTEKGGLMDFGRTVPDPSSEGPFPSDSLTQSLSPCLPGVPEKGPRVQRVRVPLLRGDVLLEGSQGEGRRGEGRRRQRKVEETAVGLDSYVLRPGVHFFQVAPTGTRSLGPVEISVRGIRRFGPGLSLRPGRNNPHDPPGRTSGLTVLEHLREKVEDGVVGPRWTFRPLVGGSGPAVKVGGSPGVVR